MKQIFINLPVKDLDKSKEFYTALGFQNYPLFTGNHQICMSWSEDILVMLQSKDFFNAGSNKQVANTEKEITASFTLPVESVSKVNAIMSKGLNAGGKERHAMIDEGFMQVRTIEDIDGHSWAFIYLDINKFKQVKYK
ncbi:MAG TPA: glyoxalase/bleomycin resistance/extradiol dioxygenase family protein [Ferruginibacter sp.]|nr:glyoxalase/bleomycin resistance/extradiol dioxygenase family protein [Ferruginibacter sp.]HMP21979.1 glyoxalase/bleomycin resistance/extradiol dioxygenase family protein [Ferruginibacter sp.]